MSSTNQSSKGRVSRSAGRFGPRYGRFIRKRIVEVEELEKATHTCPRCDRPAVKRKGTGIWECRKCGYRFAGGAYVPQTPTFRIAQRSIEKPSLPEE
jgi:large subunit ribosomal protein L37Ae